MWRMLDLQVQRRPRHLYKYFPFLISDIMCPNFFCCPVVNGVNLFNYRVTFLILVYVNASNGAIVLLNGCARCSLCVL